MLLSIFNNGSSAWLFLVFLFLWIAIFGYQLYKSQKSGSSVQTGTGTPGSKVTYSDKNISVTANPLFWFLIIGVVLILGFMLWVNADYI